MSSTSLVLLLAAAAAANAAFFESGACSTESITKTRQPLIQNPAVGAYVVVKSSTQAKPVSSPARKNVFFFFFSQSSSRICFDFDLSRDDASKAASSLRALARARRIWPMRRSARRCSTPPPTTPSRAFRLALTGAGLDNGAISAADRYRHCGRLHRVQQAKTLPGCGAQAQRHQRRRASARDRCVLRRPTRAAARRTATAFRRATRASTEFSTVVPDCARLGALRRRHHVGRRRVRRGDHRRGSQVQLLGVAPQVVVLGDVQVQVGLRDVDAHRQRSAGVHR
jgi:hypothetical protein